MVRYHDIDAAIRHGRLRGKSKTAAFIWKIHKSHKKSFFKHLFSPVRQRYRQLCRPVFFQTVKGNYPALFYSAAFSIVTRTLHDRLLRRTPSLRLQ